MFAGPENLIFRSPTPPRRTIPPPGRRLPRTMLIDGRCDSGSSIVRILQIMNGDVVRTMRDNLDLICHVQMAGTPSRAELDDSEIDYRYIAREIVDIGYDGFVCQEYTPSPGRNPLVSLAIGYDILSGRES
jgi:hypothetical protein